MSARAPSSWSPPTASIGRRRWQPATDGIVDLLDELERVLVDIAASPEELSQERLAEVRQRIESRSLLFKVRVVSADVRQRQKSIVQSRAQQRSSV